MACLRRLDAQNDYRIIFLLEPLFRVFNRYRILDMLVSRIFARDG